MERNVGNNTIIEIKEDSIEHKIIWFSFTLNEKENVNQGIVMFVFSMNNQ